MNSVAISADPVVSNVRALQRTGTSFLDITYDVSDADTPTLTVLVAVSTNNGVSWFTPASSNLTGAVGSLAVTPGINRLIVWQGFRELPALLFPHVIAKVTASDDIPSGMVLIPAGTNSGTDPDYGAYSLTVASFFMDATEVTKATWDEVYAWAVTNGYTFANAGSGKAANHPVQMVNWYDCVKWCNARSEKEGKMPCYNLADWSCNSAANGYRLPTNTEWEYAARGKLSNKRFPWGDRIDHTLANYNAYWSGGTPYYACDDGYSGCDTRYATGDTPYTSPVGAFAANGYGLYDMTGNVWEWCNDKSGSKRFIHGGSWNFYTYYARCHLGAWYIPDETSDNGGFRSVCR